MKEGEMEKGVEMIEEGKREGIEVVVEGKGVGKVVRG